MKADLSKLINFHDELNPKLWQNNNLRREVELKLLQVAKEFIKFINVENLELEDITISGSNCSYNYNDQSDIDLHLVVSSDSPCWPHLNELYMAKKTLFNDQHDIKIRDIDVEVYVQDSKQPHISNGIYSLLKDKWIKQPKMITADVDKTNVEHKYRALRFQIQIAVASEEPKKIQAMQDKIKRMRQAGLKATGEFGPENLAFKMLRNDGTLDELYAASAEAQDKSLSLPEALEDEEPKKDYEIRNYKKLDKILAKLCEMVDKGQSKDPKRYGMVAACVLDTDNHIVTGINLPAAGGKRRHAERVAIDNYHKKYGEIPKGSIIVTTCSPCSEHMDERYKEDCTQLISDAGIEKVYCGFNDPTQEEENRQFNLIETSNQKIRDKCKKFAEHFMDYEREQANENFADGKGPGRPGDSQRHGIPKGATMAQLEKASHAKGRKGQLARWQLNMRRGKKKANESVITKSKDIDSLIREPLKNPLVVLKKSLDRMESPNNDKIELLMLKIANRQGIGVDLLHKMWVDKYKKTPDAYCGIKTVEKR